jgi:hypothetical protein
MRPKKIKKLSLTKETLANLNDKELTRVIAGRASGLPWPTYCVHSICLKCPL